MVLGGAIVSLTAAILAKPEAKERYRTNRGVVKQMSQETGYRVKLRLIRHGHPLEN